MKVYRLSHPHQLKKDELPPLVCALGFFDGVHIGHKKVIRTAQQEAKARGIQSAVMTFDPHPSIVLQRDVQRVEAITPIEDKMKHIAELGVDVIFVVEFSKVFSKLQPQQFVDEYIIGLHIEHVVAGFDFTYGSFGKGTMETLSFHARDQFTQTTVGKITLDGLKVSSTHIRSLLSQGVMEEVPQFLGRQYETSGIVIDGEKRGRTIGFPTANVKVSTDYILPPVGVYAVRIRVDDTWYEGVCNVGFKPTFHSKQTYRPHVEVHIFSFSQTIYGQTVTVQWHKRLRNEQRFSGVDELIAQINQDCEDARAYFNTTNM